MTGYGCRGLRASVVAVCMLTLLVGGRAWVAGGRNMGMLILLHARAEEPLTRETLLLGQRLVRRAITVDPCMHGRSAELLELMGDYVASASEWRAYDVLCLGLQRRAERCALRGDWGRAMMWWDRGAWTMGQFDPGLVVTSRQPVSTEAAAFPLVKPDGYFVRSGDRMTLFTARGASQPVFFPGAGDYCVSVQALHSAPGPVLISAYVGSIPLGIAEYAAEDNSWGEHTWRVDITRPGRYLFTLAFVNDEVSESGDRNAVLGTVVWRGC